jgi:uncharacterized 2Fe-2S/4Fe-4S cluster protein (DUF4445 family)
MKGIETGDLRRVLVTGAFDGHLDKANARAIGFVPSSKAGASLSSGTLP